METQQHAAKTAHWVNTRSSKRCIFCRVAVACHTLYEILYSSDAPPVYTESTHAFPLCLRCYKHASNKVHSSSCIKRRLKLFGGQRSLTTDQWVKHVMASRGACQYCYMHVGYRALTLEHKHPLSGGNDHSDENVLPVCDECNQRKKNMPYAAWVEQEEMRRLAA